MGILPPATRLLLTVGLLLFWLIPLTSWWMLRGNRDEKAGFWFAGTAAYAMAVTLFALTRPEAGPYSWIAIFTLTTLSPLLMIESLRREIDRGAPWPSYWIALALGVPVSVMAVIAFSSEYLARVLFLGYLSILYGGLIWLALRIKRLWHSKALDVVIFVFSLFILTHIARILEWMLYGQALPLLSFTLLTNIVVVINFLCIIFCSFGYWGFALEKAQRRLEDSSRREIEATTREQEARYREAMALEREALLTRMVELGRLAQAGALSASIAHEINQPLTAIRLSLDSALAQLDHAQRIDAVRGLLYRASRANLRAAEIMVRIRNLFQIRSAPRDYLVVDSLVERVLNLLQQNRKTDGVRVRTVLQAPTPILGAEGELEHVLINVIGNALDSVSRLATGDRTIEIATEQEQTCTRIRVTDNGGGIAAELRDTLFDLAISTKPDGMGLGLWLARYIVERQHGRLYLAEQAGPGASFVIELPAAVTA